MVAVLREDMGATPSTKDSSSRAEAGILALIMEMPRLEATRKVQVVLIGGRAMNSGVTKGRLGLFEFAEQLWMPYMLLISLV